MQEVMQEIEFTERILTILNAAADTPNILLARDLYNQQLSTLRQTLDRLDFSISQDRMNDAL
jgi:hypothetical protein